MCEYLRYFLITLAYLLCYICNKSNASVTDEQIETSCSAILDMRNSNADLPEIFNPRNLPKARFNFVPDSTGLGLVLQKYPKSGWSGLNTMEDDNLSTGTCISIVVETEDVEILEKVLDVLTKSRLQTELILTTKSLQEWLVNKFMHVKPTFDAKILKLKNNTTEPTYETTSLKAISSPGWNKLDVSYVNYPPFSHAISNNPDKLIGIDIDLLETLQRYLGVDMSLTMAKSYNQLATNLVGDGPSDFSISEPGQTYTRYQMGIQFSRQLWAGRVHIATNNPGPVDKLHTISYPFTNSVWLGVLISTLTVLAFLLINNQMNYRLPAYYLTAVAFTALITESLPEIYLRNRKRAYSGYIAMFMWLTVGSLMAHAYKSILLASLVSVEYDKPVETFQDLLDRNILLTMPKGTLANDLMRGSSNQAMRQVEKETSRRNGYFTGGKMPQHFADMMKRGEAASILSPFYAVGKRHTTYLSKEHLPPTHNGLYYRMNMPLIPKVEKALRHIMDNGIYQGMIERNLWKQARPERDHDRATPNPELEPLRIRHMLPMIILIGIGLVVALGSFAVERFIK